jgi:RNA recognition motif-containing protein
MTDADFDRLFSDIPGCVDVRIAMDRATGQPRGFAHADFVDIDSAVQAKEKLAGVEVFGRRLRIDFSDQRNSGRRNAVPENYTYGNAVPENNAYGNAVPENNAYGNAVPENTAYGNAVPEDAGFEDPMASPSPPTQEETFEERSDDSEGGAPKPDGSY